MQQTYLDKGKYLLINVTGPPSREEIVTAIGETARYCQKYGIKRVLVDTRQTHNHLSVTDWYEVMAEGGPIHTARIRRVALVHGGDIPEFAETTAANRGLPIRLFTDATLAEQWVLEE